MFCRDLGRNSRFLTSGLVAVALLFTSCWQAKAAETKEEAPGCSVVSDNDKGPKSEQATSSAVATANLLGLYPLPQMRQRADSQILEVTIRPVSVSREAAFVVDAFVVGSCQRNAAQLSGEKYVGSFAFYPPPTEGEERVFELKIPADAASIEHPILALRLSRVGGDLTTTALQVVGTRYLE